MSEQKMQFEVSKANKFGASGTGRRETADDRDSKTVALLAHAPITFVGQLGDVYGTALASGTVLEISGVSVSIAKPESLACKICGKVHGKPTAAMVRANEGWKANRLALLYVLVQEGKPVLVSETCMAEYVLPATNAKNVTNYSELVKAFGRK